MKESVGAGDKAAMEEELGDLFFSLINYARFLQVDAETTLEKTNKKFRDRFMQMEEKAATMGKSLNEMTLQEMDQLWNEIKKQNNSLNQHLILIH